MRVREHTNNSVVIAVNTATVIWTKLSVCLCHLFWFDVGSNHHGVIIISLIITPWPTQCAGNTSSSAVAKRPRDASCQSVVSVNNTKRPVKSFYRASATQYADARYWYSKSVRLSVRQSVRNVPVSDENGLTYPHIFFTIW